jgi:hypothetical protein
MNRAIRLLAVLGVFTAGYFAGTRGQATMASATAAAPAPDTRVFEIRTYTAPPGKLVDLERRFRDHTTYIFEKHGMKNIAYFVPTDTPQSQNTLVYVIAHASREQAVKNWAAFRADPEWVTASKASEANGKIVEKTVSVFAKATDFSPIQ